MTNDDVLFRLRIHELGEDISDKVQRDAGSVTDAQITAYYNRNREQFAVPERRDLEIILTRTEAQANEAKRAIEGGTSWAAAARRYSTDALSKGNGGRLAGVARGQQDRALDTAAFAARRDVDRRPGQRPVRLVHRPRHRHHGRETEHARRVERADQRAAQTAELGSRALTEFGREFQERWQKTTNCRTGYVIDQFCENAPKPRTTSTAGGTVATTR